MTSHLHFCKICLLNRSNAQPQSVMGNNIRELDAVARGTQPTWLCFVSLWIATLKGWASSPTRIPRAENELKLFIEAPEKLMNDGVLHHPKIKATPAPPPPSKSQLRETARQMRKQKWAMEPQGAFDTLKAEGYTLLFTKASSVQVDGVGRVYGIWDLCTPYVSIVAHVPVTPRQTNNLANM